MCRINLLIVALVTVTIGASSSMDDTRTDSGQEVVPLKMGSNTIPFQHRRHQIKLNSECFHCHKTVIGKIDNWGKESAHTICIACHDLYDNGPVECKGCHTK